jgi:GT2 family glycosyltransferase
MPAATTASLLRLDNPRILTGNYDIVQRHTAVARLLDRLLAGQPRPVSLLDVGSNILNLWPQYLRAEDIRVVRCDVSPNLAGDDPNFHLLDRDGPFPFADGAFDAVVSLEVLEHMPATRRHGFISECVRVARCGAVFTCPRGAPETVAQELLLDAAYLSRHGKPHPFLQEHRECGLPTEAEVLAILQDLGHPHAAIDNAPLRTWLPLALLHEMLAEKSRHVPELAALLNRQYLPEHEAGSAGHFRKIYVCAKVPAAAGALELAGTLAGRQAPGSPLPDHLAQMQLLASLSASALSQLEEERRNHTDSLAARQAREQQRRDQETLEHHRAHHHHLDLVLSSITGSIAWRLLGPVRWLRRWFCPASPRGQRLQAAQHLQAVPGSKHGRWSVTGLHPFCLLPTSLLPGWASLRLSIRSEQPRLARLLAGLASGYALVDTFSVPPGEQVVLRQQYHFTSAVRDFRLELGGGTGEVEVRHCSVQPVARARLALDRLGLLARGPGGKRALVRKALKAVALGLRGRLGELKAHARSALRRSAGGLPQVPHTPAAPDPWYERWLENHRLTAADRLRFHREALTMPRPPRLSVLMPVYDPPAELLDKAIESVRRQTYPYWELCIADDASTQPHVRQVLERHAAADDRIRVTFRSVNGGISAASNDALAMVSGEHVAFLDHDDELAEHALSRVAEALSRDPAIDMIYSDEDKLDQDGRRCEPFFKPDWSPEYFLNSMYTGHLGVYRTALVREVGGLRSEYDLAQDYDLVLRLIARTDRIVHIPDVLYHWRKSPGSTATSFDAKPGCLAVAQRAIRSYLTMSGIDAAVESNPAVPGTNRVRYALRGRPLVSIVIPTASRTAPARGENGYHLSRCLSTMLRKSTYSPYEIVVVDNDDMPAELAQELTAFGVRRIHYRGPLNIPAKINRGAEAASGEYLLLYNDDTEVLNADWIEAMLEHAQQPAIGAVGAKLFFPDGTLQHVGVIVVDGNPGHAFHRVAGDCPCYGLAAAVCRNYSAVTGACMMTRAELFRAVGGFEEATPLSFSDVDYCLKLRERGHRIVFTPHAQVLHWESASREPVLDPREARFFQDRWRHKLLRDPYHNPNLSFVFTVLPNAHCEAREAAQRRAA